MGAAVPSPVVTRASSAGAQHHHDDGDGEPVPAGALHRRGHRLRGDGRDSAEGPHRAGCRGAVPAPTDAAHAGEEPVILGNPVAACHTSW